MRIAEIFYTVQGEGMLAGIPSVFVRTSGCNLRCRWCDTMYASWEPEGEEMPVDEVVGEVEKHRGSHVVLTGGEPMVARGVHDLAAELKKRGKHLTIETAGTVPPGGIACDLASISPKLANSTPLEGEIEDSWIEKHERLRLQPEAVRAWMKDYEFQLKFVVSGKDDLPEVGEFLASLGGEVPPARVLLMPEGTDVETLRSRTETIVDLCREKGFRFCPRLHIEWFGNTRGT